MDEKLQKAIQMLEVSAAQLFSASGSFTWSHITDFIRSIIYVCEAMYPEVQQGVNKSALAMQIWHYFDAKYKLINALDNLVNCKDFLGSVAGSIAEKYDDDILKAIVEKVIIPSMVSVFFPKKGILYV